MLWAVYAVAADAAPGGGQSPPRPDRVWIVADQQAGAVRIVIDGRDAAVIDSTGLHVRGDIAYGGTIADTGPSAPANGPGSDDRAGAAP